MLPVIVIVSPPEELPLLLKPETVAREMECGEDMVRALIATGALPAVRVGERQRLRVRRADLERYVSKLKTTTELGAETMRGVREKLQPSPMPTPQRPPSTRMRKYPNAH